MELEWKRGVHAQPGWIIRVGGGGLKQCFVSSLRAVTHPFEPALKSRIERARETAVSALLQARHASGRCWTGELSASALSTATAVTALSIVARTNAAAEARFRIPIQRGFEWLIEHQNPDGGWGDTTRSVSNISTTMLVWAAFGLAANPDAPTKACLGAAERWLATAAGSIEPDRLVDAIESRYGEDRTFSIPILTMAALCGRLGSPREAWRHVRQLPFELAALPQRWFSALQLPVVSYALPALIAIGQVRHRKRPTANAPLRWLRDRCSARTLEKLIRLQPANGGFLEATPLTSFVVMSLAGAGLEAHPVVQRGLAFLENSVRLDGSWPIDTNLATWVTTLSIAALSAGGNATILSAEERGRVREWLLGQQYCSRHPYTLAEPGGWAWTDLPGGVPDADDTAGALLALRELDPANPRVRDAMTAGVAWLRRLQNRDGGIPTFCRGWGTQPFDRSTPDVTAHTLRAWLSWRGDLDPRDQRRVDRSVEGALRFLRDAQRSDGAWVPLWFGHQDDPLGQNALYGTARVISALCALPPGREKSMFKPLARAREWLLVQQNQDGGWSGAAGAHSSVEETGLAVAALAALWEIAPPADRGLLHQGLTTGARWLADSVAAREWQEATPIGLYFAQLWYHERLYPLIFATAALNRLSELR